MILFCDQGNTRLKWAVAAPDGTLVVTGVERDAGLGGDARALIEEVSGDLATMRVGLCSVASGDRRESLAAQLREWGTGSVHTFSTKPASRRLTNGYSEPERLGVDRWLAMIGAVDGYQGPLLVVDAGTALTIDAIDGAARHLGGYILPGIQLQLLALGSGTAQIGRVAAVRGLGWGTSTSAAVANGILLSLTSAIERAAIELSGALDDTCRVILTGGDAAVLAAHTAVADAVVDPQLIFRGMFVELPPSS